MREWCVRAAGVFFLLLSSVAFSQDFPKAEIYGGYSYVNIDTNDLSSRQNANGWEASVSGNFNKWLGVEMAGGGYYKNYGADIEGVGDFHVSVSDYFYGAGPRLNFRPLFVHGLVGGDHLTGSAEGESLSQDSLAGVFGGGVQVPISPRISVRASVDYAFTRHNIFGGPSFTQNNIRAGAGIVYSFGGRSVSSPSTPKAEQGTAIVPLGVRVSTPSQGGAEVILVVPNSAAELAGLRVQDVIISIDGKLIHSAAALSTELANRGPGATAKLGCLIQGAWHTEITVVLGTSH